MSKISGSSLVRLTRKPPWGVISQIFASATNFAILVALARQQSAEQFGWTALNVALVTALVGMARNVIGTAIALSSSNNEALRSEASYGATAALVASTLLAIPAFALAVVAGSPTASVVFLVAPVVVFHDVLRQVCFSGDRIATVALTDALRLLMASAVVLCGNVFTLSGSLVILIWGISAGISAGIIIRVTRWRPFKGNLVNGSPYPRLSRAHLLGESLLSQSTPILTASSVGILLGGAALSGFRGAGTLLGPVSILFTAIPLLLLPKLAKQDAQAFWGPMVRLTPSMAALSAVCLAIAGLSIYVPASIGRAALGDSWEPTASILPIFALQFALQPWSILATVIMRLTNQTRLLVRLRAVRSLGLLAVVVAAAHFGSLIDVVTGILVIEAIGTLLYLAAAFINRGRLTYQATTGQHV